MSKTVASPIVVVLLLLVVGGCSGTLQRQGKESGAQQQASGQSSEAEVRSARSQIPLTPDIIYGVLVGEIAAQRGQLQMASSHYRLAAKLSQDPRTAERAARLAVYLNQQEAAREAVEIWLGLEPDNPVAHQVAAAIYAKARQTNLALRSLRQLVRLSNEDEGNGSEGNGYLKAVVVVGKLKDQRYGLELMRQLAAGHEDDPNALYGLAVVAAAAGDNELARSTVDKALELRPDWAQARILSSRILLRKGDMKGALAILHDAVEDEPDSALLRTAYARQLVDAHQLELAYQQFVELLKADPDNVDLAFSAGIIGLDLGKASAARQYLERVVREGSRKNEAAYYLGRLEELEGNLEKAVGWYGRVSGTYAMEAEVHRARLLAKQGRLDQAQELLQRLRVQDSEQSLKLYLIEAEVLREAKRPDEVLKLYEQALKSYPGNADLLYDRGLYAVEIGRLDIMERDLGQVIRDNPNHADALNALGYTLADQTSRYQEALGYIRRALALKPDSAAVLDSMGWVQYRLGKDRQALHYLRRAFAIEPDAEIAAHLGEVLWATGEREEAKKVWRSALAQNPEDPLLKRLMKYGPAQN